MNKTYGSVSAKELIKLLGNQDWMYALHDEFKKDYFVRLFYFLNMEEKSGKTVLPPLPDVFRAFRLTPLQAVKVVILGQDPYPTLGDAHGLAFSVQKGVRIPRSLNNIYTELKNELRTEALKLREDCPDGDTFFKDGNLEPWARQGVLLLNTVLTVNEGEPNSHQQKGWEQFTDAAIKALVKRNKPAVFILWGANARKKKELILSCMSELSDTTEPALRPKTAEIHILEASHPSPLSASRGFFGSAPFSKSNAFLLGQGLAPVDWITPKSDYGV